MKYYARIAEGIVAEVIATTQDINNLYHPQFISELIACDPIVQQGWLFDGKTFKAPTPPTIDLIQVKQFLKKQIDDAAENERLKYITNGVGQSMTYQEKYNQAVDYSNKWKAHKETSDKEPNESDYLLLKAGIGIDGDTLIEVAETVTYAYAMWQKIGAAIEATRLETKAKIAEAKDADSAQAVFDALKWPELGK